MNRSLPISWRRSWSGSLVVLSNGSDRKTLSMNASICLWLYLMSKPSLLRQDLWMSMMSWQACSPLDKMHSSLAFFVSLQTQHMRLGAAWADGAVVEALLALLWELIVVAVPRKRIELEWMMNRAEAQNECFVPKSKLQFLRGQLFQEFHEWMEFNHFLSNFLLVDK